MCCGAAAKRCALWTVCAGRKGTSAPSAAAAPAPPVLPPPPPGALQLGQFTVDPAEVVVPPGARQEVSVVFRAEGNQSWSAVAGLDISERDFVDRPEGIPYELGGESCIPGDWMRAAASQSRTGGLGSPITEGNEPQRAFTCFLNTL